MPTWKCLVADSEEHLSPDEKSDQCKNYKGSLTDVSFFKIIDYPKNQFYTFDGLRTMKDAKDFCESQGGPGTPVGLDDFSYKTKGDMNIHYYRIIIEFRL